MSNIKITPKNNKNNNNNKKPQQNKKKQNKSYPHANAKPEELYDITGGFMIVTKGCNLKCKYCFVEQEAKDITLDIAIDTVDFLAKNAKKYGDIPFINFFGGEPLLKWKEIIVPVTLYARGKYGKDFRLSLTTNGVLLTKEKLEFMKKYNIGFLLSIDGDRPTQDLNRPTQNGKGSFDILKEKIPMILSYNKNATFRSTTDHDNVNEFFNNHKFAIEQGYKNVFNIVNVFAEWSEDEKIELKKQVRLLGDYFLKLFKEGKKVRFSPFQDMYSKLQRIEQYRKENVFRTKHKDILAYGRCGMGANKFASIGVRGDLYSCQEMVDNSSVGDKFIIGNIYEGMYNSKRLELTKEFKIDKVVCSEGGEEACSNCRLNCICDGSCLINNYFANGDVNIMPEILCYYYNILLEEVERVIDMANKEGLGNPFVAKKRR